MTSRIPENKPKWKNLLTFLCPKDCKVLENSPLAHVYECQNKEGCGFKISVAAFDRVVLQLYRGYGRPKRLGDDMAALEYLNNFGHNKQSADFSGDGRLKEGY